MPVSLGYWMYDHRVLYYLALLLPLAIPLFIRYVSDLEAFVAIILVVLSLIYSAHLVVYDLVFYTGYVTLINFLLALGLLRARFSHQLWDLITLALSMYAIVGVTVLEIPSNDLIEVGSRNVMVTILFFFASMGHLYRVSDGIESELLAVTSGGTTIIAILMVGGRTGVAIGIGLLTIYLVHFLSHTGASFTMLSVAGTIALIATLSGLILASNVHILSIERLLNRGLETPRWRTWSTGIRQLSAKSWLIGGPPGWPRRETGMLFHNSFLRALMVYGVAGFIGLSAGVLYLLYKYARTDASLTFLVFLLGFRITFDSHFIAPYLGILVFLLFIFPKFD
ncbi:hypothetical protein ACFR9U_02765 [Halorientalis brevis]|uniref:O-antigen ligase domain-containing protein n=1 Tax=Halorientalis brevis TaxID=1126241 RepID=A0ABD6C785_9EURY